jgi:hypothetical protein
MPSLNLHGDIYDFPLDAFLTGVVGILLSPFEEIKYIFWAQQVGQAKTIRKNEYSVLESCLLLIRDNLNVIEDEMIKEAAQKIYEALASFVALSRELADWENSNVSSYARRKHKRLTLDVGSFAISPWVANPDYQTKLKLVTKSVSLYHETLIILVSHIEPMIVSSNSEALMSQITRFKQQIPDYRLNLQVGFQEYVRIKSSELSR